MPGAKVGKALTRGKLLWKHDLGKHGTTNLSVIGNSIYMGNLMKSLLRLSADDGLFQIELSLQPYRKGPQVLLK